MGGVGGGGGGGGRMPALFFVSRLDAALVNSGVWVVEIGVVLMWVWWVWRVLGAFDG